MFVGRGLSCTFWPPSILQRYFGFALSHTTQLAGLGGCISFVGSGCGRILVGVRMVHQSQLVSSFLPLNQTGGGFVGGGLRGTFLSP